MGGSARAGHYKRGLQGKVEKNRPDTFYLNGADRWFTTNSAAGEASTSRATQPDRPVNRPGTSREYFGGSVNDGVGTYVPGQTQQPKKPVYTKEPSKGPANGISGVWKANAPPAVTNDLGKSSFKNRANGRSLTGESQQFGAVSKRDPPRHLHRPASLGARPGPLWAGALGALGDQKVGKIDFSKSSPNFTKCFHET